MCINNHDIRVRHIRSSVFGLQRVKYFQISIKPRPNNQTFLSKNVLDETVKLSNIVRYLMLDENDWFSPNIFIQHIRHDQDVIF